MSAIDPARPTMTETAAAAGGATSTVDRVSPNAHRGRLFRKYLLLIMTLVGLALLLSGGISLYFSYRETTAALASLQREKAIGAASRIEQYLRQVTQQLQYAALPQMGAADLELRRMEFLKLIRQAPEVTDIALIDADGREQIAESRLGMSVLASGKDRSGEPAFQQARRGQAWYGPVYFRKETEPYMTVAIRTGGEKSLVTVAELNLKFIWDVVSRIKIGDKGKAYVVDREGYLVADPDIGLVLRKTQMGALEHVKASQGTAAGDEPAMQSHDLAGSRVLVSAAPIESLGWTVFAEQPVSEVYARLNASILWAAALLLGGLAVSALAAGALARSMVRPIRTLDEGARRIGAGDLDQQIVVNTGDELEGLADQFNRMSGQLRESYAGLERKVEQRTGELTEALEYQTAISEVLRVISSSTTDVTPVFEAIMESAMRLFGAPIAAVFRYDGRLVHLVAQRGWPAEAIEDARRYYPGPPDPHMSSGRAILSGQTQTIVDTRADKAYDLATAKVGQWRRMIAAPMLKDGKVVGVITVAWPDPGVTPPRQTELLKTFADQAVIAIENVRLINETKEALEQQTATAEILRVISGSITNTQPVFDAIVRSCQRLLGGKAVALTLPRGEMLESVAFASDDQAHREGGFLKPWPLDAASAAGACILESTVIAVPDTTEGAKRFARMRDLALALGYRSALFVPLLRDGKALGCLGILRATTGEFDAKETSLAQTFADQAVIAIENVRLFNETKEALDQQTATAEILQVISRSVADAQPVFDAIVTSCQRLFNGLAVNLLLPEGERLCRVARASRGGAGGEQGPHDFPLDLHSVSGACVLQGRVMAIADADAVATEYPLTPELARSIGWRSGLFVPLLSEGNGLGCIGILRAEAGDFDAKEIALAQTFADQAVIAIQNARLFRETQEALERQTATAEVLQVISRSVADAQPVFEKIADSCRRLFGGERTRVVLNLVRPDGQVDCAAFLGPNPAEFKAMFPVPLDQSGTGLAISQGRVVMFDDALGQEDVPLYIRRGAERTGTRSVIVAPLLWEGQGLGALMVARGTVMPFAPDEVAQLKSFADQAVIAIQNARLFREIKEALERQTATAEILRVIAGSPADVQPVLDAIVTSASRLFDPCDATIVMLEAGMLHWRAHQPGRWREGLSAVEPARTIYPLEFNPEHILSARAIAERRLVEVTDTEAPDTPEATRRVGKAGGFRSVTFVPLLRNDEGIGVLILTSPNPGFALTGEPRALVQTFADQAVIAIQNAQLFREIQDKSHQLEIANQHKSEFLANMSHELRTPLNAIIGFSEVLTEQMFGELNDKQMEYLHDIHASGHHLLSLINDVLDLAKIEAGRMELDLSCFDLGLLLENSLMLVKERAQRGGLALSIDVDDGLQEWVADARKVKQVVVNLLSNAVKFTPTGGKVVLAARRLDDGDRTLCEISVTDTGVGIAPAEQALVFEEFRQASGDYLRKTEGTGLGLALARRFVELHGGTIRVDSAPGRGSTFTFTLPMLTLESMT